MTAFLSPPPHHPEQPQKCPSWIGLKRLDPCINPFDATDHPPELFRVALGKINVNVEEAVSLRTLQLKYFCEKLPAGFHGSFAAEVKLKMMFSDKKGMQIGDKSICDIREIYARIIRLVTTGQIVLETVLKHELALVSPLLLS